jgi:hypothetical protein
MARQRGRPREQPQDLVYLRLAVTPAEHRQIQVGAALAGVSMAQFARRSVADAARAKIVAEGLDPSRLPEADGEGTAGDGVAGKERGGAKGKTRKKK